MNRLLCCCLALVCLVSWTVSAEGQTTAHPDKFKQPDKFRQMEEILPTPNLARVGSGAPGSQYWQQKVDYEIDIALNDDKQRLQGLEKITYTNHSPDTLKYLWLQLDANIHRPDSDANLTATTESLDRLSFRAAEQMKIRDAFDGGFKITRCQATKTNLPLKHTIVKTMMRVDLPEPLASGDSFEFEIGWNYEINNSAYIRGRSGCEYFAEDGNYIYEVAQWFPRLCAYTDVTGWQHKQFLGRGEFTLEMGDYVVKITAPDDHIVASTGTLLNPDQVLTETQRQRLEAAKTAEAPIFIVTPEEAKANESSKPKGTKTWIFKADQVRDFAWASSRKFIWDALQHNQGEYPVMAMSFYPNEGEPLWSKYSTHAIIHTLEVYSRYTFDYPYPVAISVNGPVGGMEYPMICFNGPRPDKDGTYSAGTKYGLISVIIHEVGHNYFPMIVNTDERQWTWMDEGINSFLQYLAEQEWEEDYPSRGGEPKDIVGYMRSTNQVPIMTNSESILQFGPNAYTKPATALNILRETILGRELFDFAFREYAQRWKFKRPMPADFFRTMEDASGVDLDWFWRGWFYSNEHVDLAITNVQQLNVNTQNPDVEKKIARQQRAAEPQTLSQERNLPLTKRVDRYKELRDFYNSYDPLKVTPAEKEAYERTMASLSESERKMLADKRNYYLVDIENVGGLVMPVLIDAVFEDGSRQHFRFPAEIWRKDNEKITKLLITNKPVVSLVLDPRLETADTDLENNHYPPQIMKSRFQMYKSSRMFRGGGGNPMREAQAQQPARREASQPAAERPRARSNQRKAANKNAADKQDAEKKAAAKKAAAKKAADKKAAAKKAADSDAKPSQEAAARARRQAEMAREKAAEARQRVQNRRRQAMERAKQAAEKAKQEAESRKGSDKKSSGGDQ